ncbi:MAG: DUF971 domain-containing protein [Candidatus Omnitrophica bacterium]|nr:DUF971 domain-containing protein [Candidatus Omnitrophota bacterium]
MPAPTTMTQTTDHALKLLWPDGHESIYPARELRLACPCAGCVDEMTGQRRLLANAVAQDVRPLAISPVGRYAIHIRWSDGHDTGIYSFERLRKRCPCEACATQKGQVKSR